MFDLLRDYHSRPLSDLISLVRVDGAVGQTPRLDGLLREPIHTVNRQRHAFRRARDPRLSPLCLTAGIAW